MKAVRFHLVELFVIIVIIIVAFAILIPWASYENHRRIVRQSGTQMRGIHSGMVLFCNGNKDHYPGLDSNGDRTTLPIRSRAGVYGTDSTDGYEPAYRMTVLLRGNYFSPEYMRSPFDADGIKRSPVAAAGHSVGAEHFSYAMLRIDGSTDRQVSARRYEWRATNNSKAAVLSDRNLGSTAGAGAQSNQAPGKPWRGNVVFNDNHVNFEAINLFPTQYGHALSMLEPVNPFYPIPVDSITVLDIQRWGPWMETVTPHPLVPKDDLFADDLDDLGNAGNDAAMVYQDEKTYVNQK